MTDSVSYEKLNRRSHIDTDRPVQYLASAQSSAYLTRSFSLLSQLNWNPSESHR